MNALKLVPRTRGTDKAVALKALMMEAMSAGIPLLAALIGLLAEARPEDLESPERMANYQQHLKILQYRATPAVNRLLERAIDIVMG